MTRLQASQFSYSHLVICKKYNPKQAHLKMHGIKIKIIDSDWMIPLLLLQRGFFFFCDPPWEDTLVV